MNTGPYQVRVGDASAESPGQLYAAIYEGRARSDESTRELKAYASAITLDWNLSTPPLFRFVQSTAMHGGFVTVDATAKSEQVFEVFGLQVEGRFSGGASNLSARIGARKQGSAAFVWDSTSIDGASTDSVDTFVQVSILAEPGDRLELAYELTVNALAHYEFEEAMVNTADFFNTARPFIHLTPGTVLSGEAGYLSTLLGARSVVPAGGTLALVLPLTLVLALRAKRRVGNRRKA